MKTTKIATGYRELGRPLPLSRRNILSTMKSRVQCTGLPRRGAGVRGARGFPGGSRSRARATPGRMPPRNAWPGGTNPPPPPKRPNPPAWLPVLARSHRVPTELLKRYPNACSSAWSPAQDPSRASRLPATLSNARQTRRFGSESPFSHF